MSALFRLLLLIVCAFETLSADWFDYKPWFDWQSNRHFHRREYRSMPQISSRAVVDSNRLSRRWGYDRDANPKYFEDFLGEGVVVNDLFTEKVDEKTVDRTKVKKGINARNFRARVEDRRERTFRDWDYPTYGRNKYYF